MTKALMVANWKMYHTVGQSEAFVRELIRRMESLSPPETDQVLCPTLPALALVKRRVARSPIHVGAQNLDLGREGANTGAVSAYLIREAGADFVILGHSERRTLYGEDDALVALKTRAALEQHLIPIICVGESKTERDRGETDRVIRRQVTAILDGLSDMPVAALVFAYEPLWAIGTGVVADADEANRVAGLVREMVGTIGPKFEPLLRILYGGSVNPANALSFAEAPWINGALVGGASLKVESWIELNRIWGGGHVS